MSMAEDTLDGMFCEGCGEFIGEPIGYPRRCPDCADDEEGDQEDSR